MNKGKSICSILKQIRQRIAEANHIPYETRECHYDGECRGTCPACENELSYIMRQIELRRLAGKAVVVSGLCASLLTLSACHQNSEKKNDKPSIEQKDKPQVKDVVRPLERSFATMGMSGESDCLSREPLKPKRFVRFKPPVIKRDAPVPAERHSRKARLPEKTTEAIDTLDEKPDTAKSHVFGDVITTMPSFPGGNKALHQFQRT